MNKSAEKHLAKAGDFLEKGESFYHKAAGEIVAAQRADSTLSNREIGEQFGRSKEWVRQLVQWHTSGTTSPTPYAETGRPHQDQTAARKVLSTAPLEQIEQIIETLPRERRDAIGAAAGDPYRQARHEMNEQERRVTPQERAARREASETQAERMLSGFTAMAIENHLYAATDKLEEMNKHHVELPGPVARRIEKALLAFQTEFDVAKMMVGLEVE
jgi:hypothetical protein